MAQTSTQMTEAQLAAALLSGRGTTSGKAVLGPLSTRVPVYQIAQLEAMAAKAGKSRNAMVAIVLEAGLEAIRAHLDSAALKELKRLEADAMRDVSKGEDGETY